ncbi:MAG TPA: alpha-mannosidase, partial [Cyanobacteria bacterium UBA9971]|nr:alpha-mannosidase [Cyanobacteria bacterium UBA9971]
MKIIAYNHTHWDREWYKTFQEFRLRFVEVMNLIIREIKNENIDCFYLDGQTVILEDYFELYPENKVLIKDLIAKNKIIIGPWYALADEFLVSGESLFRNMLIGVKQAQELGCNKFIGYLPDSFGHSSEIPRILSAFGIKNAV